LRITLLGRFLLSIQPKFASKKTEMTRSRCNVGRNDLSSTTNLTKEIERKEKKSEKCLLLLYSPVSRHNFSFYRVFSRACVCVCVCVYITIQRICVRCFLYSPS